MGRIEWKKGYQYGLRAVKQLVDDGMHVRWRILGRGYLHDSLTFERHAFGLDDVVDVVGAVPATEVGDHLRWADILLHPAVSEGFGNAVLEAQAMQVPVVATDADGLAENVDPDRTGLIRGEPRHPEALAVAVAAVAVDGPRRVEVGLAGRRLVPSESFRLADQLDAWERFYCSVLTGDPMEAGQP